MEEIKVSIPDVYLSDLETLTKKVHHITGKEDTEISFEFIIASLFPTSWKNIQADLSRQYTKGYIQGRIDRENELAKLAYPVSHDYDDDDVNCHCD